MPVHSSRRDFLKAAASVAVGAWISPVPAWADSRSPNEKLNIGIIGAGGRGASNINGLKHQNIVALCDVDELRAAGALNTFTKAKRFHDFRKMLDDCPEIDAVAVSTPDHTHAVISMAAIRMGKHVYCEKPLAHSVHEVRVMRDAAREHKVATQMGNGRHASDDFREAVELVQSGMLGDVAEVHCWSDRPGWPQGIDRPTDTPPVPKHLDWDLWLGPAPQRAYNPAYLPFKWRGWWDFGTGALGDMGCHIIDLPVWALKLDAPTRIQAEVSSHHEETGPEKSIITYEFPARGDLPPVTLTWYDGGNKPSKDLVDGTELADNGMIIVGEKGTFYLAHGPEPAKLVPESAFADMKRPEPFIPRSPGHYKEWIIACKGGEPALSNFDNAAALTEVVLLGNIACRVDQPVEWDPVGVKFPNCPEADQYLKREYRAGWTL